MHGHSNGETREQKVVRLSDSDAVDGWLLTIVRSIAGPGAESHDFPYCHRCCHLDDRPVKAGRRVGYPYDEQRRWVFNPLCRQVRPVVA